MGTPMQSSGTGGSFWTLLKNFSCMRFVALSFIKYVSKKKTKNKFACEKCSPGVKNRLPGDFSLWRVLMCWVLTLIIKCLICLILCNKRMTRVTCKVHVVTSHVNHCQNKWMLHYFILQENLVDNNFFEKFKTNFSLKNRWRIEDNR